jgi:hypothetical protein
MQTTTITLPFGKYKDKPLALVPATYLAWVLRRVKLSSGLRAAVVAELDRNCFPAPPPPPPRPLRSCPLHPGTRPVCLWAEDTLGRRLIRAECPECGRWVDTPPCVPPYSTEADAGASAAPVLDALVKLDELGVELCSDGKTAWVADGDFDRVPPGVRHVIKQCRHRLGTMLGHKQPL